MSLPKGGYTGYADAIMDEWMADLTGSAFKILCYVYRRTYGRSVGDTAKAVYITVSEFCAGVPGQDRGTGIRSRTTTTATIEELVEMGYLLRRRDDENKANSPCRYAVNLKKRSTNWTTPENAETVENNDIPSEAVQKVDHGSESTERSKKWTMARSKKWTTTKHYKQTEEQTEDTPPLKVPRGRRPVLPSYHPEGFTEFRRIFPRNDDWPDAAVAWDSIKPTCEEQAKIAQACARFGGVKLTGETAKRVKMPGPWLRAQRWDNDDPWPGLDLDSAPRGSPHRNGNGSPPPSEMTTEAMKAQTLAWLTDTPPGKTIDITPRREGN